MPLSDEEDLFLEAGKKPGARRHRQK